MTRRPLTKRCSRCRLEKPLDAFAVTSLATRVPQAYCRPCHAAYRRAHYERNRDDYVSRAIVQMRRRYESNRARVYAYLLRHPCVDCGETDPVVLQFDHVELATKAATVTWLVNRRAWLRVAAEIAKCDIRCANCHHRRTATQFQWRKAVGDPER